MKKIEYVERYGQAAYDYQLARGRARHEENREKHEGLNSQWRKENPEKVCELGRAWREKNPGKVFERNMNISRKGGKYYKRKLVYNQTGISGDKNRIRVKHCKKWRPYKAIIAPNSQLHHQWRSNTANYTGIALVETDQHQHGIIDVIQILEGEITLFTEKEVRGG